MANILVFTLFNLLAYTFTKAHTDTSCTKRDSLKDIIVNNCHIIPDEKVPTKLKDSATHEHSKLLKFELEFPENTTNIILAKTMQSLKASNKSDLYFYTPFQWYITTSRLGQKLIMLKPNYETLSLNLLQLKTEVIHFDLQDEPAGCLKHVSSRQYFFLVKEFLQKYAKDKNKAPSLSNKVCTSVMMETDGYAEFSSICYASHNGTCMYLTSDQWSYSLQGFIRFVKFLAILFCPLLISKKFYKRKYHENPFILKTQEQISLRVKVSKEKKGTDNFKWGVSIPMSQFEKWQSFNPWLLKKEVEYELDVKEIKLGVEENRLVSSTLPIGLRTMIFRNIYRCQIRHSNGFTLCCGSPVCPCQSCCKMSSGLLWFHCCQSFMKLVGILLLPLPWIIRLVIYQFYEKNDFMTQQSAATARGARLLFEGYLLGYITALHWLFLAIYTIFSIDLLVFGTFVHRLSRKLAVGIKQCVRDMHLSWTLEGFNWVVRLFLVPFTLFGIFGIFVAPIYWVFALPFICLTIAFYYIPLVNLCLRLLMDLVWYCLPNYIINATCSDRVKHQMEQLQRQINLETLYPDQNIISKESRSTSCLFRQFQVFMVLLCLLTVGAFVILLTECIGYAIEMISFTLIGVILHSDIILPFISLGFLIIIYFFRSMNKVRLTYLDFNNIMVNEIAKLVGNFEPNTCANTAHFVSNGRFEGLRFNKFERIFCKAYSMLLFFDDQEKPLIPSKFFYRACEMPIPNLPGSLSMNFLKAFINFFFILLFLIFVAFAVLAFGEMYNISSTTKMFATLAGGFLPWFFEHILNVEVAPAEIKTESINFQNCLQKIVDDYEQKWTIIDIKGRVTALNETTDVENVTINMMDDNESDLSDEEERECSHLYVHFSKPNVTGAEQ